MIRVTQQQPAPSEAGGLFTKPSKKMPRAYVTASEHFLLMGLLFRLLLYNRYIDGAGTLISLFDIEANPLTFIKCPESGTLDRTIVDENVTAFVTLDKAKTLFLVEPLHFTFCQSHTLLSRNFSWLGLFAKKTKKPLWLKFLLQPSGCFLRLEKMCTPNSSLFPPGNFSRSPEKERNVRAAFFP